MRRSISNALRAQEEKIMDGDALKATVFTISQVANQPAIIHSRFMCILTIRVRHATLLQEDIEINQNHLYKKIIRE